MICIYISGLTETLKKLLQNEFKGKIDCETKDNETLIYLAAKYGNV